ncbi:hypothetical protein V1264_018481 [Littorina saxatilis]|uniref:Nuclear receptor domain-containing protein n=1 Tax=Littorina saxatilis TaxID=31220 RepID=A0AAN9BCR1_9CAEN
MLASPLTAAQWTPTPLTAGQAPLSPHSFWQDFLTPQEMEDTDSVPTGPYDNHLHYQHNQDTATTVTVNGTESFTPPARELSFSTHNQFMTPSRSITENSQDPRERDALAVLTTISTQHIAPLTKLEGQTGFGHDQEKAFAETHDSLSALAAITAQHPSHIHKDLCDPLKAMSAIAVDSSVAPRSGKGGKGRACGRGDGKPGGSSDVDVSSTMSRPCDVCGEPASGHYFGALVCLPCKVGGMLIVF